jgi:hypothetical protein
MGPTVELTEEVWSADFKGHFKTGDGRYCYPLTITDNNSCFLLGCEALSSTHVQEAKPVFTRVFKESACRSASAPTAVCRSPPIPSPGCPNCSRGGAPGHPAGVH